MSDPPPGIFGCVPIRERCSVCDEHGMCDKRPVVVASLPTDPTGMDLLWSCDDHIPDLIASVSEQGADPERHIFEISRTCRATGKHGAPCGAAGDYLTFRGGGGDGVITVCARHMEKWRPPPRRAQS